MKPLFVIFFCLLCLINLSHCQVVFSDPIEVDEMNLHISEIKIADFNNDGIHDVVARAPYDNAFYVYTFNNNNFTKEALEIEGATIMEVIDFNHDNLADLVCLYEVNKIAWSQNLGNGSFGEPQVLLESWYTDYIVAEDLDSDDDFDFIVVRNNYFARLWENIDNDTFIDRGAVFTGLEETKIQISDMDNDGDKDLIVKDDDRFRVYENKDSLNFEWEYSSSSYTYCYDMEVADFNNDGLNDVIVGEGGYTERYIHLYINYDNLNFLKTILHTTTTRPKILEVADMDNDSIMDYTAYFVDGSNGDYDYDLVWYNNLQGSYLAHFIHSHNSSYDFKLGDFDNDMDNDIFIVYNNQSPNEFIWCRNELNERINLNESICSGDSLLLDGSGIWTSSPGIYYDTVSKPAGGFKFFTIVLDVLELPSDFEVVGPDHVDPGQVVNYFVDENDDITYSWEITNGEIISSPSPSSVTIQWNNSNAMGQISVVSTNQNGCDRQVDIDVTIGPQGVESSGSLNKIILYPNPAKDYLQIRNCNEDINLQLFDISGNILLKSNLVKTDISFLPAGYYLIEIKNKNEKVIYSSKLLKIR